MSAAIPFFRARARAFHLFLSKVNKKRLHISQESGVLILIISRYNEKFFRRAAKKRKKGTSRRKSGAIDGTKRVHRRSPFPLYLQFSGS